MQVALLLLQVQPLLNRKLVPLCSPSLPSTVLIQLVHGLNDTRDFSSFLKKIRRAFVENLGVNAQNARKSAMG